MATPKESIEQLPVGAEDREVQTIFRMLQQLEHQKQLTLQTIIFALRIIGVIEEKLGRVGTSRRDEQ